MMVRAPGPPKPLYPIPQRERTNVDKVANILQFQVLDTVFRKFCR